MNNRRVLETFNVLRQIDNERNLPIKFDYGLGKIITELEPIVNNLQKVSEKKIEGQEEYEKDRNHIYSELADKDVDGLPIRRQVQNGFEYEIKDWITLDAKVKELKKKNIDVVEAMEARVIEYTDLLNQELEGFKPYLINIKNLPVDKEGKSQLSALQIRYLVPFLEGDIDDLPEYGVEDKDN